MKKMTMFDSRQGVIWCVKIMEKKGRKDTYSFIKYVSKKTQNGKMNFATTVK